MLRHIHKFLPAVAVLFFISCEGDMYIQYHFTGLDLENAENTGEAPVVTSADSIPKEAYVLRMNLFPVETQRDGRYVDSESPPSNSNPVDSIFITSDKMYNDTLPAGSLLNDFFLIFNGNYLNTSNLEQINITNVYSENFYDEPIPQYADLLMMIPPDTIQYYKFYVRIKLNDGTEFSDSTTAVKLY